MLTMSQDRSGPSLKFAVIPRITSIISTASVKNPRGVLTVSIMLTRSDGLRLPLFSMYALRSYASAPGLGPAEIELNVFPLYTIDSD